MPKLVVVEKKKVVSEWSIEGEETVIGRDPDCQVTLDNPSVSRRHAKVVGMYDGFIIEDLDSTNGVVLNGRRVRKHMLADGDCVYIGSIELRFEGETGSVTDSGMSGTLGSGSSKGRKVTEPTLTSQQAGRAYLRFLTGPDRGDSRLVDRSLYTIGEPGGNLAVISRRPKGYLLMHLGGDEMTLRNGKEVHGAGVELDSGDRIQVGGISLEFYTES